MWIERRDTNDDPLGYMVNFVLNSRFLTKNYLKELLESEINVVSEALNNLKQDIITSDSSKCRYYISINPDLKVHDIYNTKVRLNELERKSWTKFRLSAHSLEIETGRWNRRGRGRLPIEERLCQCGQIQTERHVVETCTMSQHVRELHNLSSLENLMVDRNDYANICHVVHTILSIYK